MATYYVDYEGGNDANAGTSFATRWKTLTNGATSARIAAGDEIRIMASPDATSIGSASWAWVPRGIYSITSSTNASPIVVTIGAHNLGTGDYVAVSSHTGNTYANGVWKVGATTSTTIELLQMDGSYTAANAVGGASGFVQNISNSFVVVPTLLTKNIALHGGLGQKPTWTANTNVTTTTPVTSKEGYGSAQIAVSATFTTGKAAHYALPATLDLSAFQQVSFWVQLSTGTLGSAGQAYLALCSDTAGNTVVHQCPIPALGATGVWFPVTVDLGTNLSTTVNSVALYVVTDVGAQTFLLNNIIACKASSANDSITLRSLISKSNGTGPESWYAINSINHDAIMVANENSNPGYSSNIRGYSGASQSVTTYKRETIKTAPLSAAASFGSILNGVGTETSPITITGGWNRTDMSTQTGRTWLDGQNGLGQGLVVAVAGYGIYNILDRLDFCRYSTGISLGAAGQVGTSITSSYVTACSTGLAFNTNTTIGMSFGTVWLNNNSTGLSASGSGHTFGAIYSNNNATGIGLSTNSFGFTFDAAEVTNSTTAGINLVNTLDCVFGSVTLNKNSGITVTLQGGLAYFNGGTISNNPGGGIAMSNGGILYMNNVTIADGAEVFAVNGNAYFAYSNRHDNTDGNSWIWQRMGTINQQTAVVDSPATTSWLMRPTVGSANASAPLQLKLGTVVCAAGSLVTVTARMRRDNTGLTMRLACPGGQISGVTSTVSAGMTAAANTWETVTITFTPTKAGAVDIYAYAFGGTTYSGYVCNLTASQA